MVDAFITRKPNFDASSSSHDENEKATCMGTRSVLPVPQFSRNDFSVWSILKQCIGKLAFSVLAFVCHTSARGPVYGGAGGIGGSGGRFGGFGGFGGTTGGAGGLRGGRGGMGMYGGGPGGSGGGGYPAGVGRGPAGSGGRPGVSSGFIGGPGGYAVGVAGYGPGVVGGFGYDNMMPKPYSTGYTAPDGQGGVQFRTEQGDGSGAVQGTYGYMDAQGLYRVVDYLADENGFKADIQTNEPGVDGKENPADVTINAEKPPAGIQEQYTDPAVLVGGVGGAGYPGSRGGVGGLPGVYGVGGFSGSGLSGRPGGYPGVGGGPFGGVPGVGISGRPGGYSGVGGGPFGGVPGVGMGRFGSPGLSGSLGGFPGAVGGYPGGLSGLAGPLGSSSGLFAGIPRSSSGKSIY